MISSDNTPPSDSLAELDAILADQPLQVSIPAPVQTDIEDFTGPTPQPVKAETAKRRLPPAAKAKPKSAAKRKRKAKSAKAKKVRKPAQKAQRVVQSATQVPHDSVPANSGVEVASKAEPEVDEPTAAESALPDISQNGAAPLPQATRQQAASQPANGNTLPRPLGYATTAAPRAPLHALGSYLQVVADAIVRVTQAPLSLVLSSLLATLSLVAQGHVNVRLLHGAAKPVSLFLLTIGVSGLRKTTVDDAASEGAKWAEAALLEARTKDDSTTIWKRVVKTGSFEGIVRTLKEGAGTLALFNDDAGSFFGSYAMSAENRMRTTAGLSQLWDGSTVSHVLADEEKSIHMAHRRLSVHFGIQPELMLPLLADASFLNQGILARFMVTMPDSNIGYRPICRPAQADLKIIKRFAFEVRDLLLEGLPYRSEASSALKPRVLELSDPVFNVFADYANEVEFAQRPYGPYATLTGPASKFAENAIRIAGVLAYFADPKATAISEDDARRAVEIMRFYATEMVRVVEVQPQSRLVASAQKVLDWLHRGWQQPTIRFQDFCQRSPVRSAADNRAIIPVLEQHGWLVRVSGNGYAGANDVWAIVQPPSAGPMVGGPSNNPPAQTAAAVTC